MAVAPQESHVIRRASDTRRLFVEIQARFGYLPIAAVALRAHAAYALLGMCG
jgi:hypothetical protein